MNDDFKAFSEAAQICIDHVNESNKLAGETLAKIKELVSKYELP